MAEYTFHPSVSQHADTRSSRASAEGQGSVDRALRDHEGLIHAVIRREGSGPLSYEEALQAGRIGLWRALLGYDPARGTAFSTYAWVAIRRHIRRAATNVVRDAALRSLLVPLAQAVDPSGRASGRSLDEELDRALVHDALLALVFELPDRLLQIIVARYGLDGRPPRSLRQLGVQFGLSHERVRQLQQEALAWLRHPAHSLCLRQRLDKNTVAEYRRALALNAALRRARRRHKG
jgi:RNA polymerase sigma factor (sigma-70 family)